MSKLIAKYRNGNYNVRLYDNGTKIRINNLNNLTPDFAESIDITITEKCNGGCQYCYLGCTEQGQHADLTNPIFNTLHSGTEVAINANDLTHPDLKNFLIRLKNKGVIVNITINQKHLTSNLDKLKNWQDEKLIWGIGISLTDSKDKNLIEATEVLKNTVIHVIDGCFTKDDLENLKDNNLKLLILGFKHKGRGIDYYNINKKDVDNNIAFLKEHLYDYRKHYSGFGFDTLAINNLNIRKIVGEKNWSRHHMGEEGEYTFYYSATDNTYSISSIDTEHIFKVKKHDTFDTMFQHIRKVAGYNKTKL